MVLLCAGIKMNCFPGHLFYHHQLAHDQVNLMIFMQCSHVYQYDSLNASLTQLTTKIHWCIFNTVAIDALMLQCSADLEFVVLDQFHTERSDVQPATLELRIIFWRILLRCLQVKMIFNWCLILYRQMVNLCIAFKFRTLKIGVNESNGSCYYNHTNQDIICLYIRASLCLEKYTWRQAVVAIVSYMI